MKTMTIREVQLVSLEILKDVHEFCVNNGICYSLAYGTLLGAIRHNGFIPWDDDVDIFMPRPDYDRFIHSYKSEKGYKLFSRELPGGEHNYRYITRVCEMDKTLLKEDLCPWTDVDTGILIDIIPIDGAPNNYEEAKRFIRNRTWRLRISWAFRYGLASWSSIFKQSRIIDIIKASIRKIIGICIPISCMDKMISHLKQYDYMTSDYVCANTTYGMGEWLPKDIVNKYTTHRFEDAEFCIFTEYDRILKSFYNNYMEIPPVEKRIIHDLYECQWK